MITVTNRRTGGYGIYIGRPSPLGNPHPVGRLSRAEAIERFRRDLEASIGTGDARDREITRLVEIYRKVGRLEITCWCNPLPCHGDVIARFIKELA